MKIALSPSARQPSLLPTFFQLLLWEGTKWPVVLNQLAVLASSCPLPQALKISPYCTWDGALTMTVMRNWREGRYGKTAQAVLSMCLLERPWCKVPPKSTRSSTLIFFFFSSFLFSCLTSEFLWWLLELAANQLRTLEF